MCKHCGAARILRGIRLAARLGLSFSKDADAAIRNLSSSIMNLAKVPQKNFIEITILSKFVILRFFFFLPVSI